MTEEEKHKLIEAWLGDTLTEAQRKIVDRLQREDPSFRREIEEQRELREALGPSRVNDFRKMVGEVMQERRAGREKIVFFLRRRAIAVAAVLVFLVIAAWWMFRPSSGTNEELFAQYFNPPAATGIFRNADTVTNAGTEIQIHKEIDSLYARGDYRQALSLLNVYGDQFPQGRSSNYYYWSGLLYLLTDQPDEALAAFDRVEAGHLYDKTWYTALAYLRIGDWRQADSVFSAIAQSESPYREEALAILQELKVRD